ncbi:uncharacterized protein VTP21DRAFT_6774 [Calcarisporiella thermophila]|uniref:uncharacterized protein n=1 Tax=Calcarisporiella thermophila TaxID=911321 RepID=UPI003743ED93
MPSAPPDTHPFCADAFHIASTLKTKNSDEKPTLENINTSPSRTFFKNSVTFKFSRFEFSSQEVVKLLYEEYQKQVTAIKIFGHSKTIMLASRTEVNAHEEVEAIREKLEAALYKYA